MIEYTTCAAAKALGWEIMRVPMKPYEACIFGKAKQTNASKNSDHETPKGNSDQIFIDISSLKGKKYGPPVQPKRH